MTQVDFDFGTKQAAVPVEIYDEDLVLVERQLSNEPTTLEPGAYFAISRTPAGREVQAKFHVGSHTPTTVSLGVVSEADDAYLEVVAPRSVSGHLARLVRRFREPRLLTYRRLPSGEWKRGPRIAPDEELADHMWPDEVIEGAVALEQADAPALFVRVPEPARRYLTFRVGRDGDGPASLAAALHHPDAGALLSYLDSGQIGLASVLAESRGMTPEALLWAKFVDPVAAAAGAYVLLQLGDLERLGVWTANLRDGFDWLPDGLVISAEHLARLGRHEEALADLRRLPERGIPCLSVGLGMATDRLRSYVRRQPEDQQLGQTLEELTRYSVATDFSAPITTFSGHAPDQPGVSPPSAKGSVLRRLVPDVLERPDGSPVFRFRLPKGFLSRRSATTTQRRSAMPETTADTPVATKPQDEGNEGQDDARLTVVRVSFAVVLTVVFLVAALLLYQKTDTKESQEWERLVYIFAAIEALAFTAVGWIFGREVNRQRADAADKRADDAEQQKDTEKEKGAKLAGLVVGERTTGGTSGLQPQGPGGGGGGQSPAVDYARRHYDL